ncbi:MAG TPA: hypothetical protein VN999_08920 [Thermoanaerobaculia bacterium]|nr:hypothetical protein [Thermoanaerobaculia bacterium]
MTPAHVVAWRPALADRALLGRVLGGNRVERRPEPPDASYLRDLTASLYTALAKAIERATGRLGLPGWLLSGIAVALASVVVALLARAWWVRRRRTRGSGAGTDAPAADAASGGRAGESELLDAAAWRFELQRRLAEQQLPEALRAAWWWLARSLAGTGAQPTWTGRELLRWSRREDLRDLVRLLDRLTYGPRPPAVEEVRQLAARLEAALA